MTLQEAKDLKQMGYVIQKHSKMSNDHNLWVRGAMQEFAELYSSKLKEENERLREIILKRHSKRWLENALQPKST